VESHDIGGAINKKILNIHAPPDFTIGYFATNAVCITIPLFFFPSKLWLVGDIGIASVTVIVCLFWDGSQVDNSIFIGRKCWR
jgi:hypothetical protein